MHNFLYTLLLSIMFCSCSQQSTDKKQDKINVANSTPIGCAPELSDKSWYSAGNKAPLFKGLEGIHFPITTKSVEAQKYFDQGLTLSFAFNHAEAGRSFFEAARQQ